MRMLQVIPKSQWLKKIVRVVYSADTNDISVREHDVESSLPSHCRQTRFVSPTLPEARCNGLNPGRIGQFEFCRGGRTAGMLFGVPVESGDLNIDDEFSKAMAFFRTRVARLAKNGLFLQSDRVKPVHTACLGCEFAHFETQSDGRHLQTECLFDDRIAAFKALDPKCVVEVRDHASDFYLVNGRMCNAKTPIDDRVELEMADKIQMTRERIRVRLDVIVVLDKATDAPSLSKTFESAARMTLQPNSVIVVNDQTGVKPSRVHATIASSCGTIPWFLTDMVEKPVSRGRCLDAGVTKAKGHYYATFSPGVEIPPDFIASLDKAVNGELMSIAVLRPYMDGEGETVALGFHRDQRVAGYEVVAKEGGGEISSPLEKAELACPKLVFDAEKICPR